MNTTSIINILQTSPIHIWQDDIDLGNTLLVRYLIITFDLILLSTLNHAKLKSLDLFTFYIDKFSTNIQLNVLNDFDFMQMKYHTNITLNQSVNFVNRTQIFIDKYKYDETNSQQISIRYELQSNQQFLQVDKNKVKINFGNFKQQEHYFGRFSIQDFQYHFYDKNLKLISSNVKKNNNLRSQSKSKQISIFNSNNQAQFVCNYDQEGGSFPVVYLNQLSNLNSKNQTYFKELIQNTQPYHAINTTSKKNQLFICHDMKGGYAQDTKFTNPVQKSRTNSYRFNYFWHTSIINYFSHKTISVPPRHWRQLCKKYQVKCLGTFIIQAGKVNEDYLLSNEFALKLVYLAKKYKYDGYLINIQDVVKNVQKLKGWLLYLTQNIHSQIPGSQISWYDSVTNLGTLEYQNQINQKNKIFYDLTDSFFSNYWWNDQKLKDDLKQASPNKIIYVGSDIWGRGTFGGGQFYTYKAIDQIQKFNQPNQPNLVPALFGPGYTYQKGGQNNNAYLKANEDRLYRGVIFDQQPISEWKKVQDKDVSILALSKQKAWYNKFYPTNLWLYKNKKKLKLTYLFRIKNDIKSQLKQFDYKIVLRIHDTLQDDTIQVQTVLKQNVKLIPKSINYAELIINTDKITSKTDFEIFIATTIQDVFEEQKLLISYYMQDLDWVQQVPITVLPFIKPYNTFLNIGHGKQFFFKGIPTHESYDYMADYDLPHTSSINNPFSTSIQHQDAYIGGSSLILLEQSVKLFYFQLPTQYNYPHQYSLKIVTKGGPIESLYFSQTNGFSIFLDKTSQNKLSSQWLQQTFELSNQNMKKMKKKFFKQLQTTLTVTVKSKCLIGQIFLNPVFLSQTKRQANKINVAISQSYKTLNKDDIVINLQLTQLSFRNSNQNQLRRYLIKIGDIFSSFVYLQKEGIQYRAKLQQISLRLDDKEIKIQVFDVDSEFRQRTLLQGTVINLRELKQSGTGHKIRIRNY